MLSRSGHDASTPASTLVSALVGGVAGVAVGFVLAQYVGGRAGLAGRRGAPASEALGPEPGYDADWEEPDDELVDAEEPESTDDLLGRRVLEAFVNDPILAERAIDIDVRPNSTVELSGTVDAEREVEYAQTLARGVPGVKRVVADLVVAH